MRTEDEIKREAKQDGRDLSEEAWAHARVVPAAEQPVQLKALRERLGLGQVAFAQRFGFSLDAVQDYEDGTRVPSGVVATLLRVIASDPEAVTRALKELPGVP